MKQFKFKPISAESFVSQLPPNWGSSVIQRQQNNISSTPADSSSVNPLNDLGTSFFSPNTHITQHIDSGSLCRTQSKQLGLVSNSNYLPKIEPFDEDINVTPELSKEIKGKIEGKINERQNKKLKKKEKSVKIQMFLKSTKEYIRNLNPSKSLESLKKKKSDIKAKSLNNLDELESPAPEGEVFNTDRNKLSSYTCINMKPVRSLGKIGSINLDLQDEKCATGDSQTSLGGELCSTKGQTQQNLGPYLKQKQTDDTIIELDHENDISPNNHEKRRRSQYFQNNILKAYSTALAVPGGVVMAALPYKHQKEENNAKTIIAKRSFQSFHKKLYDYIRILGSKIMFLASYYILFPVVIMLGAYFYENKLLQTSLNFGALGLIQGFVQLMLLVSLIDQPLKKKISNIEGKYPGLFKPSKYMTVSWIMFFIVLITNIGLQMGIGMIMDSLEIRVNFRAILIESLCIVCFTSLIWFLIIWMNSPRKLKDERKILANEIQHIEEARKHFMSDLQSTRTLLEDRESRQLSTKRDTNLYNTNKTLNTINIERAYINENSRQAQDRIENYEKSTSIDVRKLQKKAYDFSQEFRKIRLNSFRVFLVLCFALVQILAMGELSTLMMNLDTLSVKLITVIGVLSIGLIFETASPFSWKYVPKLNTTKIVSIILTSCVYRSLFLGLSKYEEIVCVMIIKFLFKTLTFGGKILLGPLFYKRFGKKGYKQPDIPHYTKQEERELAKIKHPRYILRKAMMTQEADIFFIIVAFVTLFCKEFISEGLSINFGIYVNNTKFYAWIMFGEFIIDALLVVIVLLVSQKVFKKKAPTLEINVFSDTWKMISKRKWIIFCFKVIGLFVVCFGRSNGHLALN